MRGLQEIQPVTSARGETARSRPGAPLFEEEKPTPLNEEQKKLKRAIYEKMNPRRRKFVDRIGYDQWDPFQAPNDPLDIRTDRTQRTIQQLIGAFMAVHGAAGKSAEWKKGVMECALGIIKKDDRYQGIFDFCLWYQDLLQKEGHYEKPL